MTRSVFALALLVSISVFGNSGCAAAERLIEPAPLAFDVDPAFGDQTPFQRSANTWNMFVVPAKHISLDSSGDWRIVAVEPGNGFNGVTFEDQRIIRIRPNLDPETDYLVSLHEMGHALGLHHTATGVMDPLHATDEFTPEVLDECRRVEACP